MRIAGPEGLIGVLLNFRHKKRVYAYQSGFHYSADNRLKPGLVCHVLAAQHAFNEGAQSYHFMAGESRYKRSLGNATERLVWFDIGVPGLPWAVSELVYAIRNLRHRADRIIGRLQPGRG